MAMQQCQFVDPAGVYTTYTWLNNPTQTPEASGAPAKTRNITRTSNTGTVGATKQVGDDGPYVIQWEINVFHASQETAFWTWWGRCEKQTIYLVDFDGETYEGQIISLQRERIGVLKGPGDASSRGFFSRYQMAFECYRFVSGVLAAAGVQP